MAPQVCAARACQPARFGPSVLNAAAPEAALNAAAELDEGLRRRLMEAMTASGLSGRGHARTLRAARTIADLDDAERIAEAHLAEAFAWRPPQSFR